MCSSKNKDLYAIFSLLKLATASNTSLCKRMKGAYSAYRFTGSSSISRSMITVNRKLALFLCVIFY